jgi:hypothetical protein
MRPIVFLALIAASLPAQTNSAYAPLTSSERWDYYWHSTFLSPGLYMASLAEAGGAQLAKDPPEWRRGVAGYSKEAGTIFASYAVQFSVEQGAEAALHYDPRYQRCECQGGFHRLAHAMLWSFLTKNNEGQTRFNAPVVAGAYAGGMIPFLWYPNRFSALKDGTRLGTQEIGLHVGVDLLREFSPELRRLFRFRSNP